jgi:uncharacterized protein HemY
MKMNPLLIAVSSIALLSSCGSVQKAPRNDACTLQMQYKMSVVTIENQLKTEDKPKQIQFLEEQLAYNQKQYNRTLQGCPQEYSKENKWKKDSEKFEYKNNNNSQNNPFH